jgi:hypothetical protein
VNCEHEYDDRGEKGDCRVGEPSALDYYVTGIALSDAFNKPGKPEADENVEYVRADCVRDRLLI